jgi:ribonuclease P/MRP protein subunit RPP1
VMIEYYDLCVHSLPECADSPKRLKLASERYGFTNIAITNHSPYWQPMESQEIISGIELVATNAQILRNLIDIYRDKVMILAVHGGDERINRVACSDKRVDALIHPEVGPNSGLNQTLAKLAKRNNVAIVFSIDYLWKHRGFYRSTLLAFQRKNFIICRKFALKVVLTSGALSHYDLRTPRELNALSRLIGMDRSESESALSDVPRGIVNTRLKTVPS